MSVSQRLTNLSIRNKIAAAFIGLILVILALGGSALDKFAALNESVDEITGNYLLAIQYIGDMRVAVLQYRLTLTRGLLQPPTEEAAAAVERSLRQSTEQLAALEAKYGPTVVTAEEKVAYTAYREAWSAYSQEASAILASWSSGHQQEAVDRYRTRGLDMGNRVAEVLSHDAQFNASQGQTWADRAANDYHHGREFVLSLLAGGLCLALTAGYLCVRTIAWPIRAMTAAMHRLANQDMSIDIPARGRTDEVGQMGDAVEIFRANMIRAAELATAEKAEQRAKQQRAESLENLVNGFEVKVGGLVRALSSASAEMELTARSMSSTASETNRRASTVTAAVEEASSGIQAVATAAEQLTSSIGEMNRQVAHTSQVSATPSPMHGRRSPWCAGWQRELSGSGRSSS